jgi:quercetin 2,3-dioxygenase
MKTVYDIKPLGFHWEMYDPFLFCAHHKDRYPKGNESFGPDPELLERQRHWQRFRGEGRVPHVPRRYGPGFPVHPHRGFETVTITLEGLIDHADSLGGAGRYGNGDVQWMTAGKGIQHTEMFPLLNQEKENPLELLQIWVNLPKKDKFVEPYYKMLWSEEIPVILEKDATGNTNKIMIIAGEFNGTKAVSPTPDSWAADPAEWCGNLDREMEPGAHLDLPVAKEGVARTIYNYRGEGVTVGDEAVPRYHQAKLNASAHPCRFRTATKQPHF